MEFVFLPLMRKLSYIIFILLFAGLSAKAQVSQTQGYAPASSFQDDSKSLNRPAQDTLEWPDYKKNRLNVTMGMGASFGSTMYGGSAFSTYVAPEFSYRLTPRFSMNAGIMMVSTFGNPYDSYVPSLAAGGMSSFSTVYVEGEYLLRPNLLVSGMAFKSFPLSQPAGQGWSQPGTGYQGMSLQVDYSPTKNFHFSGSITIIEGRGPGYYSPFGYRSSPYGPTASPFGHPSSPFGHYPGPF